MPDNQSNHVKDLADVTAKGALVAIAIALLVITILLGGAMLRDHQGGGVPNKDKYQVVFLQNGQAYFGHLTGVGSKYVVLSDVYSVDQANQASPAPGATPGPSLALVKRGDNKLIKPEDPMRIASDQLVSWENVSDDSEVVKAIKQKQSGATPAAQPAQ
jgi:hypothetical protein